jgi:HAMP domain-containing protein
MDPGFGDVPPFMKVAFLVFGLVFLLIVAFGVTSAVRSRKVLRDAGLDPMAVEAEIAARLARGPLAGPAKSLEQRLTELDDLHRRGLISDAEHAAARSTALGDLR